MKILKYAILAYISLAENVRASCPLVDQLEDCPSGYDLADTCACVKSVSKVSALTAPTACTAEERGSIKNFRPRTNDKVVLAAAGLEESDLLITNARNSGGTWVFNTGKKVPADKINDNGQTCLAWDQANEEYSGIACDDESLNTICIVRPKIKSLGNCVEEGSVCTSGKATALGTGDELDAGSCAKFCARAQAKADKPNDFLYFSFNGKKCECFDDCTIQEESGCKDCAAGVVGCVELEEPKLKRCVMSGVEIQLDDKKILDETDDDTGFKCKTACDGAKGCEAWVVNIKEGGCTLYQEVEGAIEDIKEDKNFLSGFKDCKSDKLPEECEIRDFELKGKSSTKAEAISTSNIASCKSLCTNIAACVYFVFDAKKETCSLLSSFDGISENNNAVSGASGCTGPVDPCSLSNYKVAGKKEILSLKVKDDNVCQLLCNIDEKCTVWSIGKKKCTTYSGQVTSVKVNKKFNSGSSKCGTDKDCAFSETAVITEETIETVDNGNADACALACAAKQKCTFFVVEENKSCALLGGAVTGFEKDAKKKTTYAKECAGGDCRVKKLAVKKGKSEQTLTATEEQCSLACGGSDCVASTFDKKKDECTLYSSIQSLESGKMVLSPQVCPSEGCFETGVLYVPRKKKNRDKVKKVDKAADCQALCALTKKCAFFFVNGRNCFLVNDQEATKEEPKKKANKYTAGPATCPPSAGAKGEVGTQEVETEGETPIEGTSSKLKGEDGKQSKKDKKNKKNKKGKNKDNDGSEIGATSSEIDGEPEDGKGKKSNKEDKKDKEAKEDGHEGEDEEDSSDDKKDKKKKKDKKEKKNKQDKSDKEHKADKEDKSDKEEKSDKKDKKNKGKEDKDKKDKK